jgi:hypothetical protein
LVSQKFGPEMNERVRLNQYVNYGETKLIIEHIYSNFYPKDFVKLVKMNLNLKHDPSESLKEKSPLELEIDLLKKRRADNAKRLAVAKSLLAKEKIQVAKLQEKRSETKNSTDTNSLTNTRIKHLMYRSVCEKVNKFSKEVEQLDQKVLAETPELNVNQAVVEKTFDLFQEKMLYYYEKVQTENPQWVKETADKVNFTSYDAANLYKYLALKSEQNKQDICVRKLEEGLKDELELYLYMHPSAKTIFSTKASHKSYTRINVESLHMEIAQRQCEMEGIKKRKQEKLDEITQIKGKIREITNQFEKPSTDLYNKYLRSYLLLKKAETTLNAFKRLNQEFERKNFILENQTQEMSKLAKDRSHKLTQLNLTQIKLEDLLRENSDFFHSHHFAIHANQIQQSSASLLELLRIFLNSPIYAAIRNGEIQRLSSVSLDIRVDHAFLGNGNRSFAQFKFPTFLASAAAKSPAFILEVLVKIMGESLQKIGDLYTGRLKFDDNSNESTLVEYLDLLRRAVRADNDNVERYLNEILKRISTLSEKFNLDFFNEFEQVISTWWSLPAAYQCILKSRTLHNKTLDFYLQRLDQAIAENDLKNNRSILPNV